jgi:hypothetical protein
VNVWRERETEKNRRKSMNILKGSEPKGKQLSIPMTPNSSWKPYASCTKAYLRGKRNPYKVSSRVGAELKSLCLLVLGTV